MVANVRVTRLLAVLLIVLLAGCGRPGVQNTGADELQLQLRLQPGMDYRFRMVVEQAMSVDMLAMESTQRTETVLRYHVERVEDDGSAWVTVTYEDVGMTMTYGGEELAELSEEANPQQAISKALIGQSLTMHLGQRGEVLEIQGTQELIDRMLEALEIEDQQMREWMRQMYDQLFGSQFGNQQSGAMGFALTYPQEPIAVGESWSNSASLQTGMVPLTMENTYTLQERRDGTAFIDLHSEMDATSVITDVMGMPMEISQLNGSQQGTLQIDEQTGMLSRSEATFVFSMTMSVGRPASVEEVFEEIEEGLNDETTGGGEDLPAEETAPMAPETMSMQMSMRGSTVQEQIACCDPLPTATPRPTPTAVPTPDREALVELLNDSYFGVSNIEILAVEQVHDELFVLYRADQESMLSTDLDGPTATPQTERALLYTTFSHHRGDWYPAMASFAAFGSAQEISHLVSFGQATAGGVHKQSLLVFGEPRDERVAAVEVLFDNGDTVRTQIAPGSGYYLVASESAEEGCEIRVFDGDQTLIEAISLASGSISGACPTAEQLTPTP